MKKNLSAYPPDRWLRHINKVEPGIWAELRHAYEDRAHLEIGPEFSKFRFGDVPDWCYFPVLFSFAYMFQKYGSTPGIDFYNQIAMDILSYGTMYVWRATKGVYRFDPELYDILIHQPLDTDLPCEHFFHLPEWAVYVETPGLFFEQVEMEGFIAHLDYDILSGNTDLQFALFAKECDRPRMIALPLGKGNINDAMDRMNALDEFIIKGKTIKRGSREEYCASFVSMIQLLLYLCSEKPDMPPIEHPRKRMTFSGIVRGPSEPRVWDVGVRISNAIRKYREEPHTEDYYPPDPGQHNSPRPHVRSAHWHTYWTGPRSATFPERRPILHWLPPIPVCMDWDDDIPTGVHDVFV